VLVVVVTEVLEELPTEAAHVLSVKLATFVWQCVECALAHVRA
jgi:hypothetical protein